MASALQAWLLEDSLAHGKSAACSLLLWPFASPHTQSRSVGCSAASLSKNQEVLRVPGHLILTAERAKQELLGKEVSDSPELHDLLEDKDELALGLAILAIVGASQSSTSTAARLKDFAVYAASLPLSEDFRDVLSQWSEDEIGTLLNDEAAASARERIAELKEDFNAVRAALDKYSGAACDAAGTSVWSHLRASFCWHNYLWARFCVQSRAFIDGLAMDPLFACEGTRDMLPIAMVPLADMFNHYSPTVNKKLRTVVEGAALDGENESSKAAAGAEAALPPVILDADWEPPSSASKGDGDHSGAYVLRCLKSVPEPAALERELCISYGDRSSIDLLENYGFSLPYPLNAHEVVTASVGVLLEALAGVEPDHEEDDDNDGRATRRAAFVNAARGICSFDADCHDPLQELKRQSWESEFGSPRTVDLPCKDSPGGDILTLMRMLAAGPADLAQLLPASASSAESASATISYWLGKRRCLSPELCEKPLNRDNEVRVVKLLALLLAYCLEPLITMTVERKAGSAATGASESSATSIPSAADLLSACRSKVAEERALQGKLKEQMQALMAPVSSSATSPAAAPHPWPVAVPVVAHSAEAAFLPIDAVTDAGMPKGATSLRRLLLASQYRQGQFAVGALQLSYVARMMALVEGAR